jgi:hypothetical protein
MPTEKNAAFLPRQQGFKLDRQRVKFTMKLEPVKMNITRRKVATVV